MISIENENTFKKAVFEGVNLFVGSGFSLLAEDSEQRPMPVGTALSSELISEFDMPYASNLTLSQICTILESQKREQLYSFLQRRFTISKFDPRYSSLESLEIKTIFTTNIDDLLFKIYASSNSHYLNDIVLRGPSFNDKTAIDLVTLHGSVAHNNEPLAFSTLEIASSFSSDPDKWHFLTNRIQQLPTLFWGYSLEDAGVLQALSPLSVKGRSHSDKWILLRNNDNAAIQYFKALGFNIIISDTSEMLDYLYGLAGKRPSKATVAFTQDLFSEDTIPSIGTVPVRPIIEFYLGAPPAWHDIFSGQLYRTSHYTKIIDSINSGRNTIAIGMPACGKTTLLMQIAANINYNGHKLLCDSLTTEKALLMVKKLGSEKAIIFVDNFADNIEAFEVLLKAPNVLVVGFDRDYVFERASHIIDDNIYNVLDVTELEDRDIQQIYSRIPREIRLGRYMRPNTEAGTMPSLYEVVESNIIKPSLKARFTSVLSQLEKQDNQLHDLLIMSCYVHSCRVPVSYDTASAFLRGHLSGPNDLYWMIDKLGSIMMDYVGNLIESEQDYFTPRSSIVSEAIIEQVPSLAFKRVLVRFHEEVSPLRICRFDIFRRKAFDEYFIGKAFTNWREGMEFYEKLYSRDASPYLKQQGALYLAHKKRFNEAFRWIDEAVMLSRNKVPSIRNSHAIILFRANINMPADDTVRRTLKQSMDILAECYTYDKRKTYHALTFADQALMYSEVFHDDVARQYLETAMRWLIEEEKRVPWHRNVKRLHRSVKNKLLTF